MQLRYVVGLLIVGLSLLIQENPLRAAMIPFAFWKKSGPATCTFSSNTTVNSGNVATYSNCIWSVGAGVTVTINYPAPISLLGLTMTSTSTITQTGCTTISCGAVIYLLISGNATIPSGAKITADGTGYLGGYQTGPDSVTNNTTTGQTVNNAAGAGATAGGSYGGWGGWNSSKATNVPPPPYGQPKGPLSYGSGGGGSAAAKKGGNGGGVIVLLVNGNLTIDGNGTTPAISSNGGSAQCGGGSGGSIYISVTGTLSSSSSGVMVGASGGTGGGTGTCGSGNNSGGGGGGRISITYSTISGTLWSGSIQAFGGTGGSGAAYYGGSGTVVIRGPSATYGDLYVNGSNNSTYKINGTPIGAFGRITSVSSSSIGFSSLYYAVGTSDYSNGANLVPDTDALSISQNAITTYSASSMSVGSGDLTTLTSVGKMWGVYDNNSTVYDTVYISDSVIVHAAVLVAANSINISNTATLVASTISANYVYLNDTAVLSPFPGDTNYIGRLKVSATALTVASGAKVSADGLGYLGAGASGVLGTNSQFKGMTFNFVTSAGSDKDCGGSHGGSGGYWADPSWATVIPGPVYDSISQPTEAGAGGGTDTLTDVAGNGGGTIIISVTTLSVDGLISAKGNTGGGSGFGGGGGAGGTINISTSTFTSASTGTVLNASGGAATNNGGGAGGRIAISYNTLGGTMAFTPAKITANGAVGFDPGTAGGAGTVFTFKPGTSTDGDLYVMDNSFSNFRGSLTAPYGFITSTTASTITDSGLTTYARDFYFTKAQVVGKVIAVGVEGTAALTEFTITDYNASTGVFTVSGGSAAGLTVGNMWIIKGFNTHYDNVNFYGTGKFDAPYLKVSNTLKTLSSANLYARIMRIDATTMDFSAGAISLDTWLSNGPIPPKPIVITATTVNIGTSSSIDLTGSGYVGGFCTYNINNGREGFCNNTSNTGYTQGNTTTGGSGSYSGGSGGGYGGMYSTNTPASPAGDALNPTTFGSGGGGDSTNSLAWGGSGGGVISLTVSGTLTVNGFISAAGSPSGTGAGGGSGGGGGSVYISADTVTSSSASSDLVDAWGGWLDTNAVTNACAGGGGSIAIYYNTMSGTFGSGDLSANGGISKINTCHGGAGTAFIKKNSDSGGQLTLWNYDRVPNYLPTPLPAYNVTFKSMSVLNAAVAKMMSNAYAYNFGTTGTVYVDGTSTLYIPNDQSNVGPYNNAVPVGTWFNVLAGKKTGNITEY